MPGGGIRISGTPATARNVMCQISVGGNIILLTPINVGTGKNIRIMLRGTVKNSRYAIPGVRIFMEVQRL